jgi:hypothetical protein
MQQYSQPFTPQQPEFRYVEPEKKYSNDIFGRRDRRVDKMFNEYSGENQPGGGPQYREQNGDWTPLSETAPSAWGSQQDLQQQSYGGPSYFQDPFGNNPYAMRPMQQPYTPTDAFGNDPYSNNGLNSPAASLDSSMRRVADIRQQGMYQFNQPYQAPQGPVGSQSVQQLDGSTASLDDVLQKRRQLSQRGY